MTVSYLQIIGGLVILIGGAEIMVRGTVTLARRLNISTLIIGMTVVAFGTSAPELVVTVQAVIVGSSDLAIGNIVGSNIANLLLIIGCSALIMPMARCKRPMIFDAAMLTLATLVFVALCVNGVIHPWAGGGMVVWLGIFLLFSYRRETTVGDDAVAASLRDETEELTFLKLPLWLAVAATVVGLIGLVLGADLLVDGGLTVARNWGVSEAVIGLTMIAIGTSLPELGASAIAAWRKQSDIAIGNVIGSNLFNMLGVGGVASLVAPLTVSSEIQTVHIWVMLAATIIFLPFILTGLRCGRLSGGLFLALYFGYIGWLAISPGDGSVLPPLNAG